MMRVMTDEEAATIRAACELAAATFGDNDITARALAYVRVFQQVAPQTEGSRAAAARYLAGHIPDWMDPEGAEDTATPYTLAL